MNIEQLTNGNYWLVQIRYPVACEAALYYLIKSKSDPNEHQFFLNNVLPEYILECVEQYSYLDCPQIDDFESKEEYEEEYEYCKENIYGEIEVEINKITPELIYNNFGEDFYAFKAIDYEISNQCISSNKRIN